MNTLKARLVLLFCICLVVIAAPTFAETSLSDMNEWCPVTTDEKAETDVWVDFEDRRVYFCCRNCRRDFLRDPGAFIGNLPVAEPTTQTDGQLPLPVTLDEGIAANAIPASEHADQEHDHARDHHASSSSLRLLGKLHPIVVHFPIALIIAALLAAVLFVVTKREIFAHCTRFLLPLGAAGAVAAAGIGWINAMYVNYPGELETVLFRHRWLGVSTAVVALVAAIVYEIAKRRKNRTGEIVALIALTLAALLVGATGHLGATLIYGTDYFAM